MKGSHAFNKMVLDGRKIYTAEDQNKQNIQYKQNKETNNAEFVSAQQAHNSCEKGVRKSAVFVEAYQWKAKRSIGLICNYDQNYI